jgi:hypothetical protein
MCTSSYTNTPKFILWLTDQTAHPRMPSSVLSSYKVGVLAYLVANPDKLPRRVRTPFRSLLDSMSLHCFPVSTNQLAAGGLRMHLGRSAAMDLLLRKTKAGECSTLHMTRVLLFAYCPTIATAQWLHRILGLPECCWTRTMGQYSAARLGFCHESEYLARRLCSRPTLDVLLPLTRNGVGADSHLCGNVVHRGGYHVYGVYFSAHCLGFVWL